MEARFEYYAFLSYSHKDIEWARWLQNRLEHFRLPVSLHKTSEGRLPRNVRPIFRDQTDLSAGPLELNLKKELEDSRFLIVICSPDSAKSEYVNREISHFVAMGRESRIIPFIVRGTPNSPADECFPPALRQLELLGVSLGELTKEQAVVKIISCLLGIKFGVLWDREKREQKNKKLRIGLAAALAVLLIAGGSYFYWDFNFHRKVSYYSDYVLLYGVVSGVREITPQEAAHRNMSYKITRLKNKVVSVEKVNGAGTLCADFNVILDSPILKMNDLPAKTVYTYKDGGDLDKATYYKHNGLQTISLDYSSKTVADIVGSDNSNAVGWSKSLVSENVLDAATGGKAQGRDAVHLRVRQPGTRQQKAQLKRL